MSAAPEQPFRTSAIQLPRRVCILAPNLSDMFEAWRCLNVVVAQFYFVRQVAVRAEQETILQWRFVHLQNDG